MINKETLSFMKPDGILINTARGALVDEKALADALREKGSPAPLWMYWNRSRQRRIIRCFLLENCLITPHIAWAAREARTRLIDLAYRNLKGYLEGSPINVVGRDSERRRDNYGISYVCTY